jgi:hypothetical protein
MEIVTVLWRFRLETLSVLHRTSEISAADPDNQIFANPYILFLYQALGNMIGMFIPDLDFLSISDLGIPDLDAQHWLEVSRT